MDDSRTHVLIAGGGVAALEAALALQSFAGGELDVELVAPETQFWYRPLAVAEPFGRGEVRHFDLPELVAGAGASFSLGETRVRRHGQEARLHRCDGALVRRPPARVRHAAPAGSARRAHVPRPGRHGRPRTPARRAGRRDGETRRVRSPRRRGLEPARVRAGAPDRGPPRRAQGLRGDARAGHPRDRAARALRRGGERGSCHDARRGGDRVPTARVSRRGAAERASPRRGRDRPRGSGRGHATSPGPTHRGHPAELRRLRPGGRARAREGPGRRLRRGGHHRLRHEAGRPRDPAGRRRRGGDRRGCGRRR